MRLAPVLLVLVVSIRAFCAEELKVTGIQAEHRNGQTFITWKDVAEGEAGGQYRYNVYRAAEPITAANLAAAELCHKGVLNHSGQQYGYAFRPAERADAKKPMAIIKEGAAPLPLWSGLAVYTARKEGKACYAVVATDLKGQPQTQLVTGASATAQAVEEKAAQLVPIKIEDSKTYGQYAKQCCITGTPNMPLMVELHASSAQGGNAGSHGDYYLFFAGPDMGHADGMPGAFTVQETHRPANNQLVFRARETIANPSGGSSLETHWFGYYCVPHGSEQPEPRAYPFTERRTDWQVAWVVEKYKADPMRVYCTGGSMGAWGSTSYGFRRPQRFAAVYPNRPRTIQKGLPSISARKKDEKVLMDDGKTDYFERMNAVKFVSEHHEDLPFFGWCCGRRDGFATWQEQLDMVKALTAARHGFAFAWNDGDHSSGAKPMDAVMKWYPPHLFALNVSYPVFGNSSIDNKPGNGDPKDGEMEGGINLGFKWELVADEEARWEVKISNELAQGEMTVDVTPRRCQKFRLAPGTAVTWKSSTGGEGKLAADAHGMVTVEKLKLDKGAATTLTLVR